MILVNSREKQGNFLFKYRGQFPILLFILAIPFLYFFPFTIYEDEKLIWNYVSISISVLGFLIRFYTVGTTLKGTSGRNTKKQIANNLNSTGIYSMVRHPLYLGNYLIWIGIIIFTYNIYFVMTVSLLFWIYYKRIMFAEDRFLEKRFGDEYLIWSKKIPSFIPSFRNYKKTIIKLSFKSILRREYSGILASVIGFTYVDVLRIYLNKEEWIITKSVLNVLIVTLIATIILRSLKHYTEILNEIDRS